MMITREQIMQEARRWVGYSESNWPNLQQYDRRNGGYGSGNYNRFSYIFDRLLDPKTYAGGNKDGYPWCATFVAMTIGTATFNRTDFLAHDVSNCIAYKKFKMRDVVLQNLNDCLYLKGGDLETASLLAGVSSFPRFTGIKKCNLAEVQPADLVIFGNSAHIGFVESVSGCQFVTIEGNTKMGIATPNGGQVCRKTYNLSTAGLTELRNGQAIPSWSLCEFFKIKLS